MTKSKALTGSVVKGLNNDHDDDIDDAAAIIATGGFSLNLHTLIAGESRKMSLKTFECCWNGMHFVTPEQHC